MGWLGKVWGFYGDHSAKFNEYAGTTYLCTLCVMENQNFIDLSVETPRRAQGCEQVEDSYGANDH